MNVSSWNEFKINRLGEYSDLYLKTDVLFGRCIWKLSTALDPAQYYTLPSFAWDNMLKITNVKLKFLLDVDVYWKRH